MCKVVVGLTILFRDSKTDNAPDFRKYSPKYRTATMKLVIKVTVALFLAGYAVNAQPSLSANEKSKSFALNEKGVDELRRGRHLAAVELFEQALAIDPAFAVAYNNLGVAYNALGRYNEAAEVLQQAIQIRPDYAEAYYDLGLSYLKRCLYEKSVKAYEQAIRYKPGFSEAQNSLGVAYNNWGKREEAMRAYHEAIRSKPDYPEAYNNLATALAESGHYEQSIFFFRRAVELRPDWPLARYNLGVAYLHINDPSAAFGQHRILKSMSERVDTVLSSRRVDGSKVIESLSDVGSASTLARKLKERISRGRVLVVSGPAGKK
jgi:tetratricopeptide (TPR) repeat protein